MGFLIILFISSHGSNGLFIIKNGAIFFFGFLINICLLSLVFLFILFLVFIRHAFFYLFILFYRDKFLFSV